MVFYILGDMGSGEESQMKVADALKKNIGNKNTFVCGLGDNIYENGVVSVDDCQFMEKFEIPYQGISDSIPFYMCLGNHDYGYSNLSLNPVKNAEVQIKYTDKSKKWKLPSKYYNYKKGDIEFFVLDTNLDMMSLNQIKKQLNTMIKKLQQSKSKWKIVYGHHTWKSIAGHGNADDELEGFLRTLYNSCPFDLYMCGHDHNKQIIDLKMNDNDFVTLIVCGTGGKVYHDYINYNELDENCELHFISNNLGFGKINALKNSLTVNFYDENNNLEYIHEIKK